LSHIYLEPLAILVIHRRGHLRFSHTFTWNHLPSSLFTAGDISALVWEFHHNFVTQVGSCGDFE